MPPAVSVAEAMEIRPNEPLVGSGGMDLHFRIYESFGDQVHLDGAGYQVRRAGSRMRAVEIGLPFRSRGATVAAMLRAVIDRCPLTLISVT
jgi:UDP-N-acetylglucosamine 1-carboxyvinyltransferase